MLEYKRKIVHILSGVAIALLVFNVPKSVSLIFVSLVLLFLSVLSLLSVQEKTKDIADLILPHFDREHDRAVFPCKGAFKFFTGMIFPIVLFDARLAAAGILVLAVGDGLAGLVGYYAGTHRLYKRKTIEGTLAFFSSSFFCLLLFSEGRIAPPWILAVSAIMASWEAVSPIDDNISIPLLASSLLFLAQSF